MIARKSRYKHRLSSLDGRRSKIFPRFELVYSILERNLRLVSPSIEDVSEYIYIYIHIKVIRGL